MKKLALLALLPLAAACGATDDTEARAPLSDNAFVTGSRIPGKGRVTTVDREEMERMRSASPQSLPEVLKDSPSR
jgi:hypothetical protein